MNQSQHENLFTTNIKSTDNNYYILFDASMIPSELFKLDVSDSFQRETESRSVERSFGCPLCPCLFRRSSAEEHSMQIQYDPVRHGQERRNRTLDIISSALSILNNDEVEEAESSAAYTSKTQHDDKATTGRSETEKKEVQCNEDDNTISKRN